MVGVGTSPWHSPQELDTKKRRRKARGTLGIGNGALFFATDTNGESVPQIEITHIQSAEIEKGKYVVLGLSAAAHVDQDMLLFHVGSKSAGDAILAKIEASKQAVGGVSRAAATSAPAPAQPARGAAADAKDEHDVVVVLYDFEAQGDDELSVSEHDQLVLLEKENDEWWKLQNAAGKVGVVPAAYVEIVGAVDVPPAPATPPATHASRPMLVSSTSKGSSLRGTPSKAAASTATSGARAAGTRSSSGGARSASSARSTSGARDARRTPAGGAEADGAPLSRRRTWLDVTGRFRVEAELLAVGQDHVRLHKANGSTIDVPLAKMSDADLEFLERLTGRSLVLPPSDAMRRGNAASRRGAARRESLAPAARDTGGSGARSSAASSRRGSAAPPRATPHHDWFEFFLEAGVDVDNCTRYASAFERDQIDESVLEDVDAPTLRNLGLREGDVIRVRRLIDRRSGRSSAASSGAPSAAATPAARSPPRSPPRSRAELEQRMRDDEALARRLQAQEIAAQRRASGASTRVERVGSAAAEPPKRAPARDAAAPPKTAAEVEAEQTLAKAATQEGRATIDAETLAKAVELVRQREKQEAAEAAKAEAAEAAAKAKADPEAALFDKLASMKPAAPAASSPAVSAQATGAAGAGMMSPPGPRAPFAPVPANQGLLQPLIPLQGTGQIVPTGTGAWPMGAQGTGFPYAQPTGAGGAGMMPMGTGMYPPSPFAGGSVPQMPMQATAQVPQPQAPQPQAPQPQAPPPLGHATAETTRDNDQYSAANVFQQMKTGAFARRDDTKPQSSGKYDALRAQPTGFASGGIVGAAPAPAPQDASPFAGGVFPGMPTGGMPTGMYGTPTGMMMPPQPQPRYWP